MKIITHKGAAHADEIMAIALITLKSGMPTPPPGLKPLDEIEIARVGDCDPEFEKAKYNGMLYVVDIGKKYDPAKNFFDHHQFAADAPPDCAFSLLARHYGYTDKDLPWMAKMAFLDSKGPFAYFEAKKGRRHESVKEVHELLGTESVFDYFPRVANLCSSSMTQYKKAVQLAYDWLEIELDWLEKKASYMEASRKNLRIIDLGTFKVAFFDQKETTGTLEICDELAAEDPTLIITGKKDERGDGYSAMRLSDNSRVNFTPRAGDADCVFAHANGFVLKWKANWDTYLDALKRSVSN